MRIWTKYLNLFSPPVIGGALALAGVYVNSIRVRATDKNKRLVEKLEDLHSSLFEMKKFLEDGRRVLHGLANKDDTFKVKETWDHYSCQRAFMLARLYFPESKKQVKELEELEDSFSLYRTSCRNFLTVIVSGGADSKENIVHELCESEELLERSRKALEDLVEKKVESIF